MSPKGSSARTTLTSNRRSADGWRRRARGWRTRHSRRRPERMCTRARRQSTPDRETDNTAAHLSSLGHTVPVDQRRCSLHVQEQKSATTTSQCHTTLTSLASSQKKAWHVQRHRQKKRRSYAWCVRHRYRPGNVAMGSRQGPSTTSRLEGGFHLHAHRHR